MRALPVRVGRIRYVLRLGALMTALGVLLACAGTATAAAPPGRAYERVTPEGKGGGDIVSAWQARPAGGGVSYAGFSAFDDSGGGAALISEYSGVRGPGGWTTIDRHPVTVGGASFFALLAPLALTDDYSALFAGALAPYSPDDADAATDFYRIQDALNVDLLSNDVPDPAAESAAGAVSADGTHFAFQSAPTATPDQPQVFDRHGGTTDVVGIDPGGTELPSASLGGGRAQQGLGLIGTLAEPSAMSRDGSRIFFSDGPSVSPRQLYVRENLSSTTQVSLSQKTGSVGDPSDQNVDFQMATPDGSNVFFITSAQLTDDATVGGGLYRYNVDTGALDYLSTGSTDPGGAAVQGVVRVSDDGSRAYFVANDALGGNGTLGSPNLYLADGGGLTFIGTLSGQDSGVWAGQGEGTHIAKATPDGSRLVFTSFADLTPDNDGGFSQVYLYDADIGGLDCISCPEGTPTQFQGQGGTLDELGNTLFLSSIPGDISDDGNLILFQSNDPLVPNDGNGQPDVYLWDNGVLRLLGSGSSSSPGIIGGLSDDGTDAFFMTRESLVPADQDNGIYDVYDARVGGGLADQQKIPASPCDGDECKPDAPAPTQFDPPGSMDLISHGNQTVGAAAFAVQRISAAARKRFARTGRLTLRVRVTGAGTVSARALARLGARKRTVASAARTARKGGTVKLTLRLSHAAMARLHASRRLKVSLRVRYSEVQRASRAELTLRRGADR
jgi:hypothetical protein